MLSRAISDRDGSSDSPRSVESIYNGQWEPLHILTRAAESERERTRDLQDRVKALEESRGGLTTEFPEHADSALLREVERLRKALTKVTAERDEARAQLARLAPPADPRGDRLLATTPRPRSAPPTARSVRAPEASERAPPSQSDQLKEVQRQILWLRRQQEELARQQGALQPCFVVWNPMPVNTFSALPPEPGLGQWRGTAADDGTLLHAAAQCRTPSPVYRSVPG